MRIVFSFRGMLLVFVLAASLLLVSLDSITPHVQAASHPFISLATTLIGEGDDFATRVLGIPWDMKRDPYPDYPSSFSNFDRSSFSSSGGMWNMQGAFDPNIYLLSPGIADTQKVLKIGDEYPIDAGKYRLFSTRLCSDINDGGVVYWYLDQFGDIPLRIGYWDPAFSVTIGCRLYVIDLASAGHQQNYAWQGQIKGFRFDPVNFNSPSTINLDWARLTTVDTSNVVAINWANITTGTNLHFYLNSTCSSTNAMPIGVITRGGVGSGTFNWGSSLLPNGDISTPYPLPESFEPDDYTVLMRIDGGGTLYCAAETLEIRGAPILSIKKPSMFSGADYASDVVLDPWGMSNSDDIVLTNDITSSNFSGGLYNATSNSDGDPWLHLNVSSPIDSSQYKYVTMRLWLEGQPPGSQQFLSVHRWVWWYLGPGVDAVTTEDMLLREGWQTYSFSLSEALIDPSSPPSSGWTGSPTVFRMDVHEEIISMDFHLDYVTITGDHQVNAGSPFAIVTELISGTSSGAVYYYDIDKNPDNGRTVMQVYSAPVPGGPNILFIPFVAKKLSPEINPLVGTHWNWDTSGVPAGSYYVSVDVSDGANTTTWYSDIPVIITN